MLEETFYKAWVKRTVIENQYAFVSLYLKKLFKE